ncbi:MAG: MYXO-CTERM sorting domain-containing protein [Myxococcota bacterium]
MWWLGSTPARAACGDGVVDLDEGCDDAGTTAGDGCDSGCAVEGGWSCAAAVLAPGTADPLDSGYAALWTPSVDGFEVVQTRNADPAVYVTPLGAAVGEVELQLSVETDLDDDFFGLTIGYDPGEADDNRGSWLLFDWKQTTQLAGTCTALAGTALSLVDGAITDQTPDLWCHQNAVTEVARGTTFGAVGWTDHAVVDVAVVTTPTRVEVWLDGALELTWDGPVPSGPVGLYALSQEAVRYTLIAPEPGVSACWPLDTDRDGLTDPEELAIGTDPAEWDSDGDKVDDRTEAVDPAAPRDTDDDGAIDPLDPDDDQDGIPTLTEGVADLDADEVPDYLDPDDDGDGAATADEPGFGTDPRDPDSDDDGAEDGVELEHGADPLDPDTDDDTLLDGAELDTDPLDADTDDDGWADAAEPGTDPTRFDTDGDGLGDGLELGVVEGVAAGVSSPGGRPFAGTDPGFVPDADPASTTDPTLADHDADGLLDGEEDPDGAFVGTIGGTGTAGAGDTDPNDEDTDDDGLLDGAELGDPRDTDSDDGGVDDGTEETADHTDPTDPADDATADPDADGWSNAEELGASTDRYDPDTDDDGLTDPLDPDPLDADRDDDGLSDSEESDTDPFDPDTDDDGLPDGLELGRDPVPGGVSDGEGLAYAGSQGYPGDQDPSTTTDPLDPDSDADTLLDGLEDSNHDGRWIASLGGTGTQGSGETDPSGVDTDSDGLGDGEERALGTSPIDLDTDDGSVDDGAEVARGTDPLDGTDDVIPPKDAEPGCGCASDRGASMWGAALALVVLVGRRRRHR